MYRISSHVPSSLVGVVAAAILVTAPGCAAMHKQQVANLRAQGEHQKAACYEACAPSDVACLQQCDASHPPQLDPRLVQLVTAAAAVDAAKASAANTQPVPASEPSSSRASSSSSSSSSSARTLTINGETYTGGDRLGQPCSLDAPCPDGYKCHLVTSRSGQCVQ